MASIRRGGDRTSRGGGGANLGFGEIDRLAGLDLGAHGQFSAPGADDEARALLLEDALHALDGVALAVEEMADAAQQIDIVGPVVAPAAAALHRLDLREPRLPEAQHMLRQIEVVRDFADRPERVWALRHQSLLARTSR